MSGKKSIYPKRLVVGGGPSFSPVDLYLPGDLGDLLDFKVTGTCYQDLAGTVPCNDGDAVFSLRAHSGRLYVASSTREPIFREAYGMTAWSNAIGANLGEFIAPAGIGQPVFNNFTILHAARLFQDISGQTGYIEGHAGGNLQISGSRQVSSSVNYRGQVTFDANTIITETNLRSRTLFMSSYSFDANAINFYYNDILHTNVSAFVGVCDWLNNQSVLRSYGYVNTGADSATVLAMIINRVLNIQEIRQIFKYCLL